MFTISSEKIDESGIKYIHNLESNTVTIHYSSAMFEQLIKVSSTSALGFHTQLNAAHSKAPIRKYPRGSNEAQIKYGVNNGAYNVVTSSDATSGASPIMDVSQIYTVSDYLKFDSLNGKKEGSSLILRDIIIYHKRHFSRRLEDDLKLDKLKIFKIQQNVKEVNAEINGYLDYPIVTFVIKKSFSLDVNKTLINRIASAYFAAYMNSYFHINKTHMEVVLRNGFGSIIPCCNDIGDHGFRLDPGIMEYNSDVRDLILEAITKTDNFINLEINVLNKYKNIDGFGEQDYQRLDGLYKQFYGEHIPKNMNYEINPEQTIYKIAVALPENFSYGQAVPLLSGIKSNYRSEGYQRFCQKLKSKFVYPGSDSECELDDPFDDIDDENIHEDINQEDNPLDKIIIMKAGFISGMAAIQVSSYAANIYEKQKLEFKTGQKKTYCSYFELDGQPIGGQTQVNVAPLSTNVFSGNGPFEAPEKIIQSIDRPVLTMDMTNATSSEEAEYISTFMDRINGKDSGQLKLLILQESLSKHPIGGDIIYGAIRIIGLRNDVYDYYSILQRVVICFDNSYQYDDTCAFLSSPMHGARTNLQDNNIMHRNRDIAGALRAYRNKK
jgi:hypothetical protein